MNDDSTLLAAVFAIGLFFGAVVSFSVTSDHWRQEMVNKGFAEWQIIKGTTELGTTDYAKEKPFLDSIVYYYDLLGQTKDEVQRKNIQKLINRQSVQAAKYANPTEFDKLIKSIGGTELNAFTANDMTVGYSPF